MNLKLSLGAVTLLAMSGLSQALASEKYQEIFKLPLTRVVDVLWVMPPCPPPTEEEPGSIGSLSMDKSDPLPAIQECGPQLNVTAYSETLIGRRLVIKKRSLNFDLNSQAHSQCQSVLAKAKDSAAAVIFKGSGSGEVVDGVYTYRFESVSYCALE
ncbi:MAG TPA: hypothetical protein VNJ01_01365 [Bacteriovoracaceae bacterium]|nr:hypothetical protein [Bacteriovoracaceae bacterium]